MSCVHPTQLIPAPGPSRGFGGGAERVPAPGAAWQEGPLCLPCCVVHFLWQMCIKPLFPPLSSCSVYPALLSRDVAIPNKLQRTFTIVVVSLLRDPRWAGWFVHWGAACWEAGGHSLLNVSYLCFGGAEQGWTRAGVPAQVMSDSHLRAQGQVGGAGCSVHTMLSNCEPTGNQTEEYRILLNLLT